MSGRPDFSAYLTELGVTLRERQARYGTRNITGAAGVLGRVRDKVARLESAVADGTPDQNDWLDLGGYAAVGWLLERGLWDERSVARRVYFAHPHPGSAACDELALALAARFAVYRPVGPFMNVEGQADWVWPVCLRAIDLSDMLVAYLPEKSLGVAAEMLYAKVQGKTVWVLAAEDVLRSSLVRFCADRLFSSTTRFMEEVQNGGNEVSAAAAGTP